MAPKDILTKEFLEEHYIRQRKSVQTIADEFGLKSNNSVRQAIRRHGLSRSTILRTADDVMTKEFLEEYYVKRNLSLKDVAHEAGFTSKTTVKRMLRKHNIPIRDTTYSAKQVASFSKRRSHHTISGKFFNSIVNGARQRKINIDLTIEDIWSLFESQSGKCAISGVDLRFNKVGERANTRTASLDRIDSDKPYTIDNVQWVHRDLNKMKMDMDQDDFIEWCHIISKYNGG